MSTAAEVSLAECGERFAAGEPVLVGGAGRSDGAFVALPAADIRADGLRRLGELGGDMVVLALEDQVADRIGLPVPAPIDAANCRDGGWSLSDRALTMRLASAADTRRRDLRVPGHVPTLRVTRGLTGEAPSGPALAVELAHASCLPGAVAVAAVLDQRGVPIPLNDAHRDRRRRGLAVVPSDELLSRAVAASLAVGGVECSLPTRDGVFRALASAPSPAGAVIVALVHGEVGGSRLVPVYEHVHCLLGDAFASTACGCRASLDRAVGTIVSRGAGVILYLKPPASAVPPLTCPRGVAAVDQAVATGLLAHLGVESITPV